MLKVTLRIVGGDAKTTEINLKLPTTIGRAREATLTLPHPLVSRQHCELFEKDGMLYVKDLGSTNGTFVDNQKIEEETLLNPEQLLTVGNVTFRAIYDATTNEVDQPVEFEEVQVGQIELNDVENSTEQTDSQSEDIHTKPTTAGKKGDKSTQPEKPGKTQKPAAHTTAGTDTVYVPNSSEIDLAGDENQKKDSNPDKQTPADQPQHSIVAAMDKIDDRRSAKSVSLSAIDKLGVEGQQQESVSSIDLHEDDQSNKMVGQSFLDVVVDEDQVDEKISADDSSLGSFIRKMPK